MWNMERRGSPSNQLKVGYSSVKFRFFTFQSEDFLLLIVKHYNGYKDLLFLFIYHSTLPLSLQGSLLSFFISVSFVFSRVFLRFFIEWEVNGLPYSRCVIANLFRDYIVASWIAVSD